MAQYSGCIRTTLGELVKWYTKKDVRPDITIVDEATVSTCNEELHISFYSHTLHYPQHLGEYDGASVTVRATTNGPAAGKLINEEVSILESDPTHVPHRCSDAYAPLSAFGVIHERLGRVRVHLLSLYRGVFHQYGRYAW